MKIFLSSDMEGTAGIVDWAQCVGPGPLYEDGRALLLGEVNAAIDGAVEAGASSVVVNDSHGSMHNLPPEPFCPGIEIVQVKKSLGRTGAHSLHPEAARERIRAGARHAVERLARGEFHRPDIMLPATVDIDFRTEEMAEVVCDLGGRVQRTDLRTARISDEDPLRLFRTFLAANSLTRALSVIRRVPPIG